MHRKPFVLVASVIALSPAASIAQPIGSQFSLDLSLVARTGNPATGIADVTGPVVISNTESIRIELRYRIADLVANNVASRGLAASVIVISNDRGSAAGSVRKSFLTNSQLGPGAFAPVNDGALDPDTSGQDDFDSTGMVEPFRGFASNASSANGAFYTDPLSPISPPGIRLDGGGFAITPTVLATPNHQSWLGPITTNIGPSSTDTNPATWGLYSFDYIPAPGFTGSISFTADAPPDRISGNKFAFFTRTGTLNNAGVTSAGTTNSTPGTITINVVPAPGAAGVFALISFAALRRRR